ncbi:MAG: NAD(P)H-dependent oxidoreductase [Bacteroidota bacterium]
MLKIAIVSGSARLGRQTPKAVNFLAQQIKNHEEVSRVQILDVKEYNFPVMEERLGRNPNPPERLEEFSQHLIEADALIFASPEYNGSFSGALKNTLDYFRKEYVRKPIGIMTVASGKFAGVNASHDLQKYILALGGFPLPRKLMIGGVGNLFDEEGNLLDEKQAGSFEKFIADFLWLTDAVVRKKEGEKA